MAEAIKLAEVAVDFISRGFAPVMDQIDRIGGATRRLTYAPTAGLPSPQSTAISTEAATGGASIERAAKSMERSAKQMERASEAFGRSMLITTVRFAGILNLMNSVTKAATGRSLMDRVPKSVWSTAGGGAAAAARSMLGKIVPALLAIVGVFELLKLQMKIWESLIKVAIAVWTKSLTEGAARVPAWAKAWEKMQLIIDRIFANMGEPLVRALLPIIQYWTSLAEVFERFTRGDHFRGFANVVEFFAKTISDAADYILQKIEEFAAGYKILFGANLLGERVEYTSKKQQTSEFIGLDQLTKTLQGRIGLSDETKELRANGQKLSEIAKGIGQLNAAFAAKGFAGGVTP